MTKGGKGRIPNTLVAASFAAVLAVYAAGYSRTREEARRMDARAQERRPVRAVPTPAPAVEEAAVIEPPATPAAPPSAAPPSAAPPSGSQGIPAQAQAAAQTATSRPPPPATPEPVTPSPAPGPAAPAVSAAELATSAEPASVPQSDPLPAHAGQWRDGTYTGWGTSRHGDIKAQVVIRNGRIMDASVASCETRYPCDVIADIIPQPVARQSPEVDRVSRATESADAYYYGLVEALKEAQTAPDGDAAATP